MYFEAHIMPFLLDFLSFSMPTIRIITAAATVEPTENEWKRAIFCVAADE